MKLRGGRLIFGSSTFLNCKVWWGLENPESTALKRNLSTSRINHEDAARDFRAMIKK
jgi:hypothetical protein